MTAELRKQLDPPAGPRADIEDRARVSLGEMSLEQSTDEPTPSSEAPYYDTYDSRTPTQLTRPSRNIESSLPFRPAWRIL